MLLRIIFAMLTIYRRRLVSTIHAIFSFYSRSYNHFSFTQARRRDVEFSQNEITRSQNHASANYVSYKLLACFCYWKCFLWLRCFCDFLMTRRWYITWQFFLIVIFNLLIIFSRSQSWLFRFASWFFCDDFRSFVVEFQRRRFNTFALETLQCFFCIA